MILKTRKYIGNLYFMIPFLSILLFSSCAQEQTKNEIIEMAKKENRLLISVANNKNIREVSNDELFRGIFFHEGVVAETVPILNSSKTAIDQIYSSRSNEFQNKYSLFKSEVMDLISTLDPNYIDNLKTSIINDNYYELRDLLIKGEDLKRQASFLSPTFGSRYSTMDNALEGINIADFNMDTEEGRLAFQVEVTDRIQASGGTEDDSFLLVAFALFWVVAGYWAWVLVDVFMPIAPPNGDQNIALDAHVNDIILHL